MCVCTYIYICMYVCNDVCVCIYIYIYIMKRQIYVQDSNHKHIKSRVAA